MIWRRRQLAKTTRIYTANAPFAGCAVENMCIKSYRSSQFDPYPRYLGRSVGGIAARRNRDGAARASPSAGHEYPVPLPRLGASTSKLRCWVSASICSIARFEWLAARHHATIDLAFKLKQISQSALYIHILSFSAAAWPAAAAAEASAASRWIHQPSPALATAPPPRPPRRRWGRRSCSTRPQRRARAAVGAGTSGCTWVATASVR